MRLFITGSSGFIGKHVKHSIPKGIKLFCVDYPEHDLHNAENTIDIIKKFRPTHCIHLAWYAGQGYAKAPDNISWVHSSLNLIQNFYAYGGKRFIGVGTCFEYAHTGKPCDEVATLTIPKTAYGFAKLCVSNYLQMRHIADHISFAWCRPFYILGLGEPAHRLIPSACEHFLENRTFSVTNGSSILDYMDVRDVARALVAVLLSDYNGIVNIGTGTGVKIRMLLEVLKDVGSSQSTIIAPHGNKVIDYIVANTDILRTAIQFNPAFTLTQSLTDCYQYAKERIENERI